MKNYLFIARCNRIEATCEFEGKSLDDKKMLKEVYEWLMDAENGTFCNCLERESREEITSTITINAYEIKFNDDFDSTFSSDVVLGAYDYAEKKAKENEKIRKKKEREDEIAEYERLKAKFDSFTS